MVCPVQAVAELGKLLPGIRKPAQPVIVWMRHYQLNSPLQCALSQWAVPEAQAVLHSQGDTML